MNKLFLLFTTLFLLAGAEKEKPEELSFKKSLMQAFSLIFTSELGDRTQIMVIIFSAKFKWWVLLPLACSTMVSMHCISTLIGFTIYHLIPKFWTEVAVKWLFLSLGTWMICSTSYQMYRNQAP